MTVSFPEGWIASRLLREWFGEVHGQAAEPGRFLRHGAYDAGFRLASHAFKQVLKPVITHGCTMVQDHYVITRALIYPMVHFFGPAMAIFVLDAFAVVILFCVPLYPFKCLCAGTRCNEDDFVTFTGVFPKMLNAVPQRS
jgi:hypothetical protein